MEFAYCVEVKLFIYFARFFHSDSYLDRETFYRGGIDSQHKIYHTSKVRKRNDLLQQCFKSNPLVGV